MTERRSVQYSLYVSTYSQINGMRKKFLPSSLVTFAQPKQDILSYPNKELRILDEGILWSEQKTRPSLIQHFVY